MKTQFKIFILLLICLQAGFAFGQNSLYNPNVIQKLEIFFTDENWDYQLDTAKLGVGNYNVATVKINGTVFDSVGVKYKGNSSFDSTFKKNPWNISLDEFKSQSYDGYKSLKLANIYGDPSMVREAVAYNVLKNYMACPKANFVQVYVNGEYIGLYTNTEPINKAFCTNYFGSKSNTFIECSPTVTTTPTIKGSYRYLSTTDTSAGSTYQKTYEMKSTTGWADLLELCNAATNDTANLPNLMYLDEAIWMLAFDNVILNLDSYIGVFAQNHYLYKDNAGLFHPIIWDLNMSFGGFQHAGQGNTGMGTIPLASLPSMSLSLHQSDNNWPLINVVLNNQQYKRMYMAHAKTIYNEFLANGKYRTMATDFQSLIDTCVASDNNKFFSYDQFKKGMDSTYTYQSLTIPGFSTIMDARASYLKTTSEFSATQPTISNVIAETEGNSLLVTVSIEDVSNAVLAYRKNGTNNEFIKIQMYDDGNHGDGVANDGIFGAEIPAITDLGIVDYFIYAENNNAGRFSPERAQYEFYSYDASVDESDIYWINDDFSTHATESDYITTVKDRPTVPNDINVTTYYANIETQSGTCGTGNGIRIRGLKDGGYAEFTVPNTQHTSISVKAKSSSADRTMKIYRNGVLADSISGLDQNHCYEYVDSVKSAEPVTYKVTGGVADNTNPVVISSIQVEKYHTVEITTQPQGGIYGSASQLSVAATGEGTLTYQWYKSGNAIANATASTYTISSIGSYYVMVKDSYDSLQSKTVQITKAMLTVTAQGDTVEQGFDPASYAGRYSITGFVNSETENVLQTKPTVNISSTITSATAEGVYPNAIEVSGATADNYNFKYVFGTLTVEYITAIDQLILYNTQFKIYPNPTRGTLYIETQTKFKQWELYSVAGVKLLSGNTQTIDMQSMPVGLYILKVASDDNIEIKKVIKEK